MKLPKEDWLYKESEKMSKEEFKTLFKELCENEEISFKIEQSNDGYNYLRIYIDGKFVVENIIYR